MRKNILIIGGIITAIAVFMFFTALIGSYYAFNELSAALFAYILLTGFILLFIGPPIAIVGAILKKERKKSSGRICQKCGREIPFDAVVCPYCQYVFTDILRHEY